MFIDILLDACIDTLKLLPFLFLTYLLMEYLEHKTQSKQSRVIQKDSPLSPAIGAACGMIPQCGFSAAAASLYSGGLLSMGTLLAVFLSTSDEMLPLFLGASLPIPFILKTILGKAAIGAVTGILLDRFLIFYRKANRKHVHHEKKIHELCEQEHCRCESGMFASALRHTLIIALFLFVTAIIVQLLFTLIGTDVLQAFLSSKPVFGLIFAVLIGLIPNCGASVALTQFYLYGILNFGQMMGGLLAGSGVGLLLLFRTNRNKKENFCFLAVLVLSGLVWGGILELFC